MLEYAVVNWYPPRTPAEHLVAGRFRAVRIRGMGEGDRTRTTTSRQFIDAVARAVNRMGAFPSEGLLCAPPGSPSYALELVPAVRTQQEVGLGSPHCGFVSVEVGGRVQPALIDPDNAITEITEAFLGE
jgi:hypothetical protein